MCGACSQTYPIVGAITGALTFMVYKTWHAAALNPEVKWDKDRRSTQFSFNEEEGKEWKEAMKRGSRWNRPGVDVGAVSIFEGWFKPERKEGSAMEFGPAPPKTA